ncbi:MAG: PTS glucose/sucrose transporter subunit IIB [Pseudonocardiaceae bacterium]
MTPSDKFTNAATALLPHLGGTTNITSVVHCITRLRFTLLDRSVVDETALLTHPAILGLVDAHTFQVIVGPYAAAPLATAFARLLDQHDPPVHSCQ